MGAALFDYSPLSSRLTFGVTDAQVLVKVQNLIADRRNGALVFRLPEEKFGVATPSVDRAQLWSINRSGTGVYLASMKKAFKLGAAVAFSFDHIQPRGDKREHLAFSVDEFVDDVQTATVTLDVELVDEPCSIDAFWAEQIQIRPDEGATLSWRTARATTVSLRWGSTVRENLPAKVPDEQQGIKPMVMPRAPLGVGEITYTLRGSTPTGWTERSVTVSVAQVSAAISADPSRVDPGGDTTVSWTTRNATWATLDGADLPATDVAAGTRTREPEDSHRYQLEAGDDFGNTGVASVDVYWNPVEIVLFDADRARVLAGEIVHLSWATKAASEVSITPGLGLVAPAGEADVRPAHPTTYTLSARGVSQPGKPTDLVRTRPVTAGPRRYFGSSGRNATTAQPYIRVDASEGRYSSPGWLSPWDASTANATKRIEIVSSGQGWDGVWEILRYAEYVAGSIRVGTLEMRTLPPAWDPDFHQVQLVIVQPPNPLVADLVSVGLFTAPRADPLLPLFHRFARQERAYVEVEVRNTGADTWTNGGDTPVELVTYPPNRKSEFADATWPGGRADTAARLREASVPPGQSGSFGFYITVANSVASGAHDETFWLVRQKDENFGEPIHVRLIVA